MRELAYQALGFLRNRPLLVGPSLEGAKPHDGDQRHDHAEQDRLLKQSTQVIPEDRLAARDLGTLRGEVGIVQLFDLLRDRQDRLTPRYQDRKSTRLNSSHSQISYAVFCLKKK